MLLACTSGSVGAQSNVELTIPKMHEVSEDLVNYSPDSALILLDLAAVQIEQLEDHDLAEAYWADNNLRRADYWVFDDPPQAKRYLDKAHGYFDTHVDNRKLAEIYCLKAQIVKIGGGMKVDAIQKSIPYFDTAISYALQQQDPGKKAFIYYEKAITLQQTERWHESLENALQNLHYAELSGDSLSIAMAYFLMGRTYNYFGFGDLSETNMSNAVKYSKGMSLRHTIIHTYANILTENGQVDLALENYQLALKMCLERQRLDQAMLIFTSMGRLQLKLGRYQDAEESFLAVNELAGNFDHLSAATMLFKAEMLKHNGSDEQVLVELEKINKTYGTSGLYAMDIDVYKGVADLYASLNRPIESSAFYKKWGISKDSLRAYTDRVQLGELKKLYINEREKNEEITEKNEALEESRTAQANMGLAFLALILVAGGLTFYIRMRGVKETQRLRFALKSKQLEQLMEGQEVERQRIARELHDGIGQSLAALKIQMQFDEDPNAMKHTVERVDSLCNEVRTLSHQMMPMALRENGMAEAIKQLVNRSFSNTEIDADVVVLGVQDRFPEKIEIHLYRILQELIANIIKHANATKVGVQLVLRKDALVLIVEDNGVGFEAKGKPDGIGIGNIYSRVDALRGEMKIRSSPENGTCIHLAIPLDTLENYKIG